MKTLHGEEVPGKTLLMIDLPVPVDKVVEILHPSQTENRKKWDQAFADHEILESYPDGSYVTYLKVITSWPLTDRSFVMFSPPPQKVDWYGKDAMMIIDKNAWHNSKPRGADGCVRATNGGNFTILIPDEKDPTGACKMFGLRNNKYNGWLPQAVMRIALSMKLPSTFNLYRKGIIEAYNKYYKGAR